MLDAAPMRSAHPFVALADGRLRDGANVLLCAFGLGLTWGAGVVRGGTAHA
jgi:3-oxoacyl-[acyl-carrier-protein] synthase III